MKLALLATVLLIGSNVVVVSGEKNLNFKLVTIYMEEKGGESHLTGVTISPEGSSVPRTSTIRQAKTVRPRATAFTISRMEPLQ
jgi:hypothetical protein